MISCYKSKNIILSVGAIFMACVVSILFAGCNFNDKNLKNSDYTLVFNKSVEILNTEINKTSATPNDVTISAGESLIMDVDEKQMKVWSKVDDTGVFTHTPMMITLATAYAGGISSSDNAFVSQAVVEGKFMQISGEWINLKLKIEEREGKVYGQSVVTSLETFNQVMYCEFAVQFNFDKSKVEKLESALLFNAAPDAPTTFTFARYTENKGLTVLNGNENELADVSKNLPNSAIVKGERFNLFNTKYNAFKKLKTDKSGLDFSSAYDQVFGA